MDILQYCGQGIGLECVRKTSVQCSLYACQEISLIVLVEAKKDHFKLISSLLLKKHIVHADVEELFLVSCNTPPREASKRRASPR